MKVTFNLRDYLYQHGDVTVNFGLDDFLEAAEVPEAVEFDVHDLLEKQRAIALIWDADMLTSTYPHLTKDHAWEVLRICQQNYRAEQGLAWDDVSEVVNEMFPDPDDIRQNRVQRFGLAVSGYDGDWPETVNLVDMLADARHWCDAKGLDYSQINGTAYDHYLVERDRKGV